MQDLRRRATLGVALLASVLALGAPAALAAPATVNLRVEGRSATIFEGPVRTDAKTLTKDASGPHECDGTNGGANPTPGATMTTALDDGAIVGGFTWDGTWFSFGDFSIDRIGPDAATASEYWGYALNFKPSQVGGCQQQVRSGDDVLFAFDFFSKAHLLRLAAPPTAEAGRSVTVTVTDGQDGSPVAGASVGGAVTGPDGTASVTFSSPGTQSLKAERADSVRSNAAWVCVHAGDDGTCGTAAPAPAAGAPAARDARLPAVSIAGIRNGQRFRARRAPRLLRGSVDPGAAGLHAVRLRLRRAVGPRCWFFSAKIERFRRGRCAATWFVYTIGDRPQWSYLLPARLGPGRYVLDVVAIDRWVRVVRRTVRFAVLRAGR
jgi:hypothetical protein